MEKIIKFVTIGSGNIANDKLPEYPYPWDFPDYVEDKYLTTEWYFYLIPQEDRWLNPNFEKVE